MVRAAAPVAEVAQLSQQKAANTFIINLPTFHPLTFRACFVLPSNCYFLGIHVTINSICWCIQNLERPKNKLTVLTKNITKFVGMITSKILLKQHISISNSLQSVTILTFCYIRSAPRQTSFILHLF